jgi:hypothetical protein
VCLHATFYARHDPRSTFVAMARQKTFEERIQDEMPEWFQHVNLRQAPYDLGQEWGYWIQRAVETKRAKTKSSVKRFNDRLRLIK